MATSAVSFSFPEKVVIVTGGNNGIGAATVSEFLKAGAKVAVFDIRPPTEPSSNEKRLDVTCDIGNEDQATAAVAKVVETWGTVDILCNVAGIVDAMDRVAETETSIWDRCFKVNVNGPFYLIRACTQNFLSKPATDPITSRGSIVNVCSTASIAGAHAGAAYTASKHALLGLSRNTAWMHARDGIRCNAVLPAKVATNIMGNSGYGWEDVQHKPGMAEVMRISGLMDGYVQAEDVARMILSAAGNESMNGAEVVIDKALTMV